MKTLRLLMTGMVCLSGYIGVCAEKYVGGDISMLPDFEKAGATYYSNTGTKFNDLIQYSYEQGMNAMRVRIFVDPDQFISDNLSTIKSDEKNFYMARANQSYEFILPLCKRIQAAGHKLLLDFHYSDTWADPDYQYTPAAWKDLSDSDLYTKIYDYTKEVLTNLKNEGVVPEFIQTGNEISYGMCYMPYGGSNSKKMYVTKNDSKLTRFKNLLEKAIAACREVCPKSKIVLHTERVATTSYATSYYDWAKNNNIDYDIIGLSYYFYYHGPTSQLDATLTAIDKKNYGKDIWIVETGCYINWEMGDEDKRDYEATDAGQNEFATDLLTVLDKHPSVNGLFWWEMDYNAKGADTSDNYYYINNWYNASLFDNNTGRATSAFYTIANWTSSQSSSSGSTETTTSDYYLVCNQGGEWTYPGTPMTKNSDGTFTVTNVYMSQTGEDSAWFVLDSSGGSSWGEVSSSLMGPTDSSANVINEFPATSLVGTYDGTPWEVPKGSYDLTFDPANKLLKIKVSGTEDSSETTGPSDSNTGSDSGTGSGSGDTSDNNNSGNNGGTTDSGSNSGGSGSTDSDTGTNGSGGGDTGSNGNGSGSGSTGSDGGVGSGNNNGGSGSTGSDDGSSSGNNNGGSGSTGSDGGSSSGNNNGGSGSTGSDDGVGSGNNNGGSGSTGSDGGSTDSDGDTGATDSGGGSSDNTETMDPSEEVEEAGIDGITVDDTPVYYNLQGHKVEHPGRGIYIRVVNGKRDKVMFR